MPSAPAYGDVYHSADGALGQARHVFLHGTGLPARWAGRERFDILETGFGLGLNFLATWQAWRADTARPAQLSYVAVEKHPCRREDLQAIYARLLGPELAPLAAELLRAWPPLTAGGHRIYLHRGQIALTLFFGAAEPLLRKLTLQAGALYLDGFAPSVNPDMWSPGLCKALARLAAPDARYATWSVARPVRDALAAAGFSVQKQPGFGHKGEMLAGGLLPRLQQLAAQHAVQPARDRSAVVIGAGLAGCAIAQRLAARGWEVSLVERHAAVAQEASGNLSGLARPMLALDDNLAARFSRAAFLMLRRHLEALAEQALPLIWGGGGVLQLAQDARQAAHQNAAIARQGFPAEYVQCFDAAQASARLAWPVDLPGWFFPAAAWVHPPSLCAANLAHAGARISQRFSHTAVSLHYDTGNWNVLDGDAKLIAAAPVLVLASAYEARNFAAAAALPLKRIRGQVTHLPQSLLPHLDIGLCREGYLAPGHDGRLCLGASFDFDDDDTEPRASGHAANLARLERLLPGASAGLDAARLCGRVAFRTASLDRMPLIGALPDPQAVVNPGWQLRALPRLPGAWCALGYGARGLVWNTLAAELLADQIEAAPCAIETDLAAAVDPARFALRAARRGGTDGA